LTLLVITSDMLPLKYVLSQKSKKGLMGYMTWKNFYNKFTLFNNLDCKIIFCSWKSLTVGPLDKLLWRVLAPHFPFETDPIYL